MFGLHGRPSAHSSTHFVVTLDSFARSPPYHSRHACCGVTPLMHEERKIPREEDWLITRESSACKSAAYSCDSSIYD